MFFYTDIADAPWTVVKSNDKKRARLEALRYVLSRVAYQDKDERVVGRPDPLIVGPAPLLHEKGERSALTGGLVRAGHAAARRCPAACAWATAWTGRSPSSARWNASITTRPADRAASATSAASASFEANGFSQSTCLPAAMERRRVMRQASSAPAGYAAGPG
jgi:hypothetical protein